MTSNESTVASRDFRCIAERFLDELPTYERLATEAERTLLAGARANGVPCEVKSRAKDITSFLGKVIRKQLSNPFAQVRDRAGVRAIVMYRDFIDPMRDVVRDSFVVLSEEDRTVKIGPAELGYLGVHFDAKLKPVSGGGNTDLEDLVFEIQIHTRGQSAWAEVSHDLLYKTEGAEPPKALERQVNRAQALTEIFDEEVSRARAGLLEHEGHLEARLMSFLEPHYLRLTDVPHSPVLSGEVLRVLRATLSPDDVSRFPRLIAEWVEERKTKLSELYGLYREDSRRNPLLFQPETLLIFNRIEANPFSLRDAWAERLPNDLLEDLAVIWGTPLDF